MSAPHILAVVEAAPSLYDRTGDIKDINHRVVLLADARAAAGVAPADARLSAWEQRLLDFKATVDALNRINEVYKVQDEYEAHLVSWRGRILGDLDTVLASHAELIMARAEAQWPIGSRVTCDFHHGITCTITAIHDDHSFSYVLDEPHHLGPRHGRIEDGRAYTRDGWRLVSSQPKEPR